MDVHDTIFCMFLVLMIVISGLIFIPYIFGKSIEQDITITYSDSNGIIDSCDNFYSATEMSGETLTKINKISKNNDIPIKVKMFIPNKNLSPIPSIFHNRIEKVISGTSIKSNNCN